MLTWLRSSGVVLVLPLVCAVTIAACGSSVGSNFQPGGMDSGVTDDGSMHGGSDSGHTTNDSGSLLGGGDSGSSSGGGNTDAAAGFDVQPSGLQTLSVTVGQPIPTIVFKALENGQPVTAGWTVDRGNLGAITQGASVTGTFTPTASGGGLVTVTAGRNNVTITRQVFIKLTAKQNGANPMAPGEAAQIPTSLGQLTSGGGVGGVGGEGLGGAVTDMPTLAALGSPSAANGSTEGLAWLYPYDGTVWPRGVLAPLLQWTWTIGDADAIEIQLQTTSGSFSWTGTFARPAILTQSGGKYIRAPIPQDVWEMATNTAGGPLPSGTGVDNLGVSLVVAKSGMGYGPISETWTVAPGLLDGIIYYNSYGTQLVQNYSGAVGGNGEFGGAVLSIHVGDTAPKVAAGTNTMNSGCRVCHSVAAQGARLVVQHGDSYSTSSAYDLLATGNVEHVMSNDAQFPGMYPDGTLALTESGLLLPLPNDATPRTTTGLLSGDLGAPAFSPDGTHMVSNPQAGSSTVTTPGQQLWVQSFDEATGAFGNATLVVDDTGQPAGPSNGSSPTPDVRPGWGAFLPDGNSIVFQHQSSVGIDGDGGDLYTRKGEKSQIAWTSSTDSKHVTVLNGLNGLKPTGGISYLPKLATATPAGLTCSADGYTVNTFNPLHDDDVDVNYEPTVNPVPAGGYVWVVFTSRRMYGNVATIPPYCSDPRGVNLITNITTKKLWVAAIDVSGKPGADASHPAFYLPAQELLAGNSRGFWVQAPCLADGTSCMTGDQCCNGYCEQGSADAGLVCGNKPPNATCSAQGDKCTSNADCCLTTDQCINGFCEQATVQ